MAAGFFEGENPTRRYKWFRPRQAARGIVAMAAGGQPGGVGLFNDSLAAQLIVVRHLACTANSAINSTSGIGYFKGYVTGALGVSQPLLPNGAKIPGIMWADTGSNTYPADFQLTGFSTQSPSAQWSHDFPIAVLEPGWSVVAHLGSGVGIMLTALWESIYPEELDYIY